MNQNKWIILIAYGMYFFEVAAFSQITGGLCSNDLSAAISLIMEPNVPLSTVDMTLKREDPNQVLSLLNEYAAADDGLKATRAILYLNRLAELHPQPEVRKQVVNIMVVNLSSPNVARRCYGILNGSYQARDFCEKSLGIIHQRLHNEYSSIGDWTIRLSGIADMHDQRVRLNEIIADDMEILERLKPVEIPWNFTKTWDARLAKSRLGVQEDIEWCVSKIKKEIESNPIFSVTLLDDLGYIRQPQSVELLKEYFFSDRKLPSTGVIEEPFCSYLIPILRDNFIGFPELRPVHDRSRYFTQKEIELCREWLVGQTELSIRR